MRNCLLPTAAVALLLACGCATFDGLGARRSDVDAFMTGVEARTAMALADDAPLDLDRCIAIALAHNLDIQTSDLEARLAKLNRRIAFANFLPEVTLNYSYTELNHAPASAIGPISATVQDRIVRDTALQAQQPIFAPATWFLYALHQRGEAIGEIAARYTRQMIALQVAGLYFQCLATEESRRILDAQHAAAEALVSEVAAYHTEGMVTDADLAQARVLLLAREHALLMNSRARERNLAELLTAMGLAPTAEAQLARSAALETPPGELEDWILEALLRHPRLAIADQLVAIEREKVRIAIADFLPALAGFAGRSHSSNSFLRYPYVSAFGFAGVMTVFNGFANVNAYRAARTEQEKAFLAREQESLALMLEVVRARLNLEDALATGALAEAAAAAAEATLTEETAKMREGLLRPSELLAIRAKRDEAQTNAVNAYYQTQVMIAIARNVLGLDALEEKEDTDE